MRLFIFIYKNFKKFFEIAIEIRVKNVFDFVSNKCFFRKQKFCFKQIDKS